MSYLWAQQGLELGGHFLLWQPLVPIVQNRQILELAYNNQRYEHMLTISCKLILDKNENVLLKGKGKIWMLFLTLSLLVVNFEDR